MKKYDNYPSFDEYINNVLKSPEDVVGFLDVAIEDYQTDGDAGALLSAIKRVAEAQGGISELAVKAQVNRQNLYKIFNNKISPRFNTLMKILKALGYSIQIKKIEALES